MAPKDIRHQCTSERATKLQFLFLLDTSWQFFLALALRGYPPGPPSPAAPPPPPRFQFRLACQRCRLCFSTFRTSVFRKQYGRVITKPCNNGKNIMLYLGIVFKVPNQLNSYKCLI